MTTATMIPTAALHDEALSRVRDYTDPEGGNRRANRLQTANVATYERAREATANFQHAVAFADDYQDVLEAALAAVDSYRYTTAAELIGTELREHVRSTMINKPVYEHDATRPALEFLNEQLIGLMKTVRQQEPALKGITTPREAMRAGGAAQDAWEVLEQMLDRYESIRAVQRKITVLLPGEATGPLHVALVNRSGHLRASFDHEQTWTASRVIARRADTPDVGELDFLEWVRNVGTPEFERDPRNVFPDGDRMTYLRWLADGDKAWVPTIAELHHFDELSLVMISTGPTERRLAAKEEYYTARDIKPRPTRKGGAFE